MYKNSFLIILLLSLLKISCTSSHFEKSFEIPDSAWSSDEIFQFNVEITDTNVPYNMYINIRNSTTYNYSNIFLFVNVLYPDNTLFTDTVEGFLADYRGEWLGKGTSNFRSNKFNYKQNIRFPQTGTYVFAIQQAMRYDVLKGISNIGLEVEQVKIQ